MTKINYNVRHNVNFIQSYEFDKGMIMRVGNETNIHVKLKQNDFCVDMLFPIEEMISSISQNKNGKFRFNEAKNEYTNEKSKPIFFEFEKNANNLLIKGTGPNLKNKSETIETVISFEDFISFVKNVVKDYKEIIVFETIGNKIDRNKFQKKTEKIDKFLAKEF